MSHENIERVRRGFAAFNRGDVEGLCQTKQDALEAAGIEGGD